MNFENSKIYNLHRLVVNLLDKINLKRSDVALSNLSFYFTGENLSRKNEFKTAPICNHKFELPDGSYSVSEN